MYRITYPLISSKSTSHDQAHAQAVGSLVGLAPESFYELFPFRESFPLHERGGDAAAGCCRR